MTVDPKTGEPLTTKQVNSKRSYEEPADESNPRRSRHGSRHAEEVTFHHACAHGSARSARPEDRLRASIQRFLIFFS